jgi:hypothetical protein
MSRRRSASSSIAADVAHEIEACQIAEEAHRQRVADLEAQLSARDAPPPGDDRGETGADFSRETFDPEASPQ